MARAFDHCLASVARRAFSLWIGIRSKLSGEYCSCPLIRTSFPHSRPGLAPSALHPGFRLSRGEAGGLLALELFATRRLGPGVGGRPLESQRALDRRLGGGVGRIAHSPVLPLIPLWDVHCRRTRAPNVGFRRETQRLLLARSSLPSPPHRGAQADLVRAGVGWPEGLWLASRQAVGIGRQGITSTPSPGKMLNCGWPSNIRAAVSWSSASTMT